MNKVAIIVLYAQKFLDSVNAIYSTEKSKIKTNKREGQN